MALADYDIVVLKEDTQIPPFDCGDADLNDFLKEEAKLYFDELLAVTYIVVDREQNRTAAYFSLLNDRIELIPGEQKRWNKLNRKISNPKRRRNYPAVKIGRLGVSKEYAGRGLGTDILSFLKQTFVRGNRTGCRFLTVDAYADAIGFYRSEQCRFEFFTEKDKEDATRLMIFDLKPFKDAVNRK